MRAMRLSEPALLRDRPDPLALSEIAAPHPAEGQVRIRVAACGVCHTELDEIEGRTPPRTLPCIPGHQVVGRVDAVGGGVDPVWIERRVGVGWIFRACGACRWCTTGRENLCERFEATGRDADGGYAELMTAPADFVHPIPDVFSDVEAAPLLCAGAIGYRSLRLANLTDGEPLGLTGFGASGHLVLQLARHRYPRSQVYVFARDAAERAFARELGAVWTGDTRERAPEPLAAVIDTTPAWTPVVHALANLDRGGRLVVNAIRKLDADRSALADLDYETQLWLEKSMVSVANVTRADIRDCLRVAAAIPIRPEVEIYDLTAANQALRDLATKRVRGGKVLRVAV